MRRTTELGALQHEFLEYVEIERGRSVKTVENYAHYLTRFFEHAEVAKPRDITEPLVREYRLWLNRQEAHPQRSTQERTTLKKKTQNYHLIALRAFLKYLRKRGITSLEPERIELAKVGERSLDILTNNELQSLLATPNGSGERALRDRAILHTLFSTGLRVSELCSLNTDIDLSRDDLSIRGKGDKVRVVFLSEEAKRALCAWLSARKDIEVALFVTVGSRAYAPRTRITPRSVQRIIQSYAVKAGITRRVTPHMIRHMFATDLLGNGADLRSVQALLGHASITTTQVYTHITDAHLRNIHKRFHGTKGKVL